MNWLGRVFRAAFGGVLRHQVRQQLAAETEQHFLVGASRLNQNDFDRHDADRQTVLENSLAAWRSNPLARRVVELTTQYVVGGGLMIQSTDATVQDWLMAFWQHPLNHMAVRVHEMCDELTRTGNLFVLLATDAAGMSYLRVLPAVEIDRIESSPNDVEQVRCYYGKADVQTQQTPVYQAFQRMQDCRNADGTFQTVMLHYAINRPAGAQWGEPDLAPLLPWLSRYSAWLEDRVRLNRFRNAFMYTVQARFVSEAARRARQMELTANPPAPGSILVTDESEQWAVLSPKLEALDASMDGLALKKMIAAGAGVPLHFLAEPESATRTTAEAAGGPTYRRFEQRQKFFIWLVEDLLRVVLLRRAAVDASLNAFAPFSVHGADISARDNVSLAYSGAQVGGLFEKLFDMGLVGEEELLRVVYRFIGEAKTPQDVLAQGSGVDRRAQKGAAEPVKPVKMPATLLGAEAD